MKTSMPVARTVLAVFVLVFTFGAGVARADVDPAQVAGLEGAVDSAIGPRVPSVFRNARATYLDAYGVVVTIEVALDVPRNPFSGSRSTEDVREGALERIESIREGAIDVLAGEAARLDGLGPEERVTVIVYTVNPNPVDLPDLPSQILVSVRNRDAVDLAADRTTRADFGQKVQIRED